MNNRIKKHIGTILLLLLIIGLYGLAAANSRSYADGKAALMLYKKTDFLSGIEGAKLQEQNAERERPFVFTLWGSKKKQEISGQEGDKSTGEIIWICGSSEQLFPRDVVLDQEDRSSCLLSGDLAYRLYGTREVAGLGIIYQGKEYQIKGVLKEARETMVLQSDPQTEAIMDAAALTIPQDRLSSLEAKDFEQLYGDADFKVNLNAVTGWGRFIVNLLPMCILYVFIWNSVKKTVVWRRFPIKSLALTVCFLSLIGGFFFLTDWKTGLSFSFMPPKWSDFGYWGGVAEELQKSLTDFMTSEKRAPEHMIITNVLRTAGYIVPSITLFLWKGKKIEPLTAVELLLYASVSLGAMCLIAVFQDTGNRYLTSHIGIWLQLPCFLLAQYVFPRIKEPL